LGFGVDEVKISPRHHHKYVIPHITCHVTGS
jgi:hypothetical protein